ncbi:DUF1854 domain-containing protein [Bacillus sp. FSL K6-3431]|uniref:DUF1854 domain-containing protein n=1 Tax=Bacillus sp. FSL K6-3431 TaxID=2921500 RepID=UPI0030F61EE6
MEELFDSLFLQPGEIQLQRQTGGLLQAVIKGDMHEEVIIYQAFPFTKPAQYISFRNAEGEELGIVKDLSELDSLSRDELETELHLRYLIPKVTKIKKIKQEPGLWVFDLITDRGNLRMLMRNLHEHIKILNSERILFTDIDGLRCEIADRNQLDFNSMKELQKIM